MDMVDDGVFTHLASFSLFGGMDMKVLLVHDCIPCDGIDGFNDDTIVDVDINFGCKDFFIFAKMW